MRPASGAVRRGGRGFVAEDERRGGGREDDGLVAPRRAQVPEQAVHEDLVAGDHVAAPDPVAAPDDRSRGGGGAVEGVVRHADDKALEPELAAREGVLGDLVGLARDGEQHVARRVVAVGADGERAARVRDDVAVPAPGDGPLEDLEGREAVGERRRVARHGVRPVERRLHRARRDLEGLEEVGAERHRDAERDDRRLDPRVELGEGALRRRAERGLERGARGLARRVERGGGLRAAPALRFARRAERGDRLGEGFGAVGRQHVAVHRERLSHLRLERLRAAPRGLGAPADREAGEAPQAPEDGGVERGGEQDDERGGRHGGGF